jgi:hypothetical protein
VSNERQAEPLRFDEGRSIPVAPSHAQKLVLWCLLFLICIGFGYPTLNRYDPRQVNGLYDTRAYYAMVTGDPLQSDQTDLSHRVLVPWLARPVYWLTKGHLKTWNPVFFALLVSNSFFIATSAFLLVALGFHIVGDYPIALLGGLIYLANFAIANFNLSGYVDSSVNCLLLLIACALFWERWWILPILGFVGGFSKETFVPLATAFAFAWWLATCKRGALKLKRLAWIGAMTLVALATVAYIMSRGPYANTPLSFAASRQSDLGAGHFYLSGLFRCLLAREFIFVFAWLLPLGLLRIGRLPRPWVAASTAAALTALALGAYDDALGNATRAVFSACGPVLSLSVALLLVETSKRKARSALPDAR